MTLEEKIGQLTMAAAGHAVTGPVLASGVTRGHSRRADRQPPQHLGSAGGACRSENRGGRDKARHSASDRLRCFAWARNHFPDPARRGGFVRSTLWERSAREAAIEAAADGINMTFAPMLDIARDPRWGRIAEGPGEDPFVGAEFAKAKVRGFQGPGLPEGLAGAGAVAATAKHFCAYGAALAGCDYASADVSERDFARSLFASLRGGGGGGLRRDHAGFQRCGRHPDDRPCSVAPRLAAPGHWLRRRDRQRL